MRIRPPATRLTIFLAAIAWAVPALAATPEADADAARARLDYPMAIELYRKVPSPSRALRLKLANACFWLAVEREKLDGEQEHWLKESIRELETVVAAGGSRGELAEAHAQLGRSYGQLALHRGGKGKIELGRKIKEQADLALGLDPVNAQAHAVLGKWHHELAGLSGIERGVGGLLFGEIPHGNYESALTELRQAVKLAPDVPYFRLLLAQTLMELKRKPEARKELEAMGKLKPIESADEGYLKSGREILRKLGPT